ncbi:MAG: hypothetical protein N2556_08610, partial [Anaerolineae bacterium]|nr:hypothetical protein [Anaerolineae bacterium]
MGETLFAEENRSIKVSGDVQSSALVTGNYNVVIQYFTQPVQRLPADYAARIRNFLTAYLGTPEHPVPFGGRDDALANLNRWLNDPAVPYLLLTAPAGRGKSALLVRWVAALRERRSDLRIAFVPVSIRYGTNLAGVAFAALAAQLADAFGEPVPAGADTPDEVWRGICAGYMSRTPPGPLLVVLDGVDEAANWEPDAALFPLNPPPGLKVVVSARQTATYPTPDAWRRALGWDCIPPVCTLELDRLTRAGVADVLRKMGFPLDQLGARVDIVAELHRLSEGDPLLVRLYVDDLWERREVAARLRPEDLRAIQPGYEGYFDRWWEDQRRLWGREAPLRERSVREVLNLLSAALGPLTKEDFLYLAKLGEADLDSWTLEEALRPLARFVIQTGEGYVFGHPRLGDYFFGRLSPDERRALETRFLRWGQEMLDALRTESISPADVPVYLVRYYRAHLGRAGAPLEAYRPLVEVGEWAKAWYGYEGSHGGYLGDVRATWERAVEENRQATAQDHLAPHLGTDCLLYTS